MSYHFRGAVKAITERIFPVSTTDFQKVSEVHEKLAYEYVANLPLQMAFYFNSFYSPFWFIGSLLALTLEFYNLDPVYKVINTSVLILYGVLECVRLYLGFCGNLMEMVPELAGSWLLTVFIQLPGISFLLFNHHMILSAFERSIHIIEFTFVLFESILGFFVIKLFIRHQAIKFHTHLYTHKEKAFENKSFEHY